MNDKRRTTLLPSYPRGQNAMRVLSASHSGDSMIHPAHERVCPQCNGSVNRVRRRFIDRLVSLITPVHRYRCHAKGWGCDWEGNLP